MPSGQLFNLEIFVDIIHKTPTLPIQIQSFRAWEAKKYLIYIRIAFFLEKLKKIETFNDKINVFELLKIFLKGHKNYDYMIRKHDFKQSGFNELTTFLTNTIKTTFNGLKVETIKNQRIFDILLDKIENNKVYLNHTDPIQIYRSILTLKPLQIVTVLYDNVEKMFILQVYNNGKSKMDENRIKLKKLELLIPFAKELLGLGLKEKLGYRS